MNRFFKAMAAAASVAALTVSGFVPSFSAVQTSSALTAHAVDDTGDDWLHAKGSRLYDMNGNEVWLTGANWFGFNCTECVPHYLWSGDIDDMVKDIADHGVNVLRLPVSTELLYNWMIGDPDPIASVNPNDDPNYPINVDLINPDGSVANSQQTFDVLLAKCKKYGIKCFIDIHSPESNNSGHNYGIWYGKSFEGRDGKTVEVTTDVWIETLAWCADHYKNDDTLIGFDLKNEPHSTYGGAPVDAIWDDSDALQEARILLWQLVIKHRYKPGAPFHTFFSRCYRNRLNNLYRDYLLRNPVRCGSVTLGWEGHQPIIVGVVKFNSDYVERYRAAQSVRNRRLYEKRRAAAGKKHTFTNYNIDRPTCDGLHLKCRFPIRHG